MQQQGAMLAHATGLDLKLALQRLASCPVVGRMEVCAESPTTYVDYACTPQAIQRCIKNLATHVYDRPFGRGLWLRWRS